MIKYSTFAFLICVSVSLASDFEKKFTRLLNTNSDSEQKLYGATSDTNRSNSNEGMIVTFPQKLDHFKSTNKVTWEQRVLILNTYYEKPGPIFLYLFGNEEASMDWLRKSQIMSYAKDLKALVMGLEHRFYGESRPFKNTSLEYLDYLNVQQALADTAYFVNSVKGIPGAPANTKWISFGGFYGGSLAAWARKKYPHLIHGAVASSPILNIKSEYPEFLESVKNCYFSYNATCARRIESAFQQLNQCFSDESGRANVTKLFNLCKPLTSNEEDMALLQGTLTNMISSAVQYVHENRFSMRFVCDIMNRQSESAMESLASVNSQYLYLRNRRCWYCSKKVLISMYQESQYELRSQSNRLWLYQLCTELGMNLPSTNSVDMFGKYKPNIESLAADCQVVFGPGSDQQAITNGVEEINIEFEASTLNVSRLMIICGSMDPWREAAVLKNVDFAQYEFIYINGTGHRADLMKPSEVNENWNNAIHRIFNLLKSWIL